MDSLRFSGEKKKIIIVFNRKITLCHMENRDIIRSDKSVNSGDKGLLNPSAIPQGREDSFLYLQSVFSLWLSGS
jgi:hypothetical protein